MWGASHATNCSAESNSICLATGQGKAVEAAASAPKKRGLPCINGFALTNLSCHRSERLYKCRLLLMRLQRVPPALPMRLPERPQEAPPAKCKLLLMRLQRVPPTLLMKLPKRLQEAPPANHISISFKSLSKSSSMLRAAAPAQRSVCPAPKAA